MSTYATPRMLKRPKVTYAASSSKLRLLIDQDPTYGLRRLKLGGRELEDLPRELFDLTELEYLALSPDRKSCLFFRLTSVPRDIRRLVNLRVLCLDTNELTEFNPAVCQLEHLERLVLSNNLLTTLPPEFQQLHRLKSLHLANNYLEEVPVPVFELSQLEFLDVSDNKLLELSGRIGDLVNLEALLLLFNLLESLPDTIGRCANLCNLWLGMNRLTTLPRAVGRLQRLDWAEHGHSSNLEGNPLVFPPIEVCRRGPTSIAKYYHDYGTSPQREVMDEDDDILSDNSGSSLGDSMDYRQSQRMDDITESGREPTRLLMGSHQIQASFDSDFLTDGPDASPWKPSRPDNQPGRQRQRHPGMFGEA